MLRRDILTSGFALFLFMGPAVADPPRSWRVAYVSSGSAGKFVEAFRRALNSLGYEEGKNIAIDIREAKGNFSLLPDLVVAATPADLEAAFAAMKSSNCDALYVLADPYRPTIPQLAQTFGLPAIYQVDLYVEEGGLMSYGPDALGLFARAAYYVDRIIKGGNAADIPVEQPTTFRFIVNLRTAKALGVTMPETVLLQADRIIE